MVGRVSTAGNYSVVLANLMAAQQRQREAGDQVATQKNGSDLKDYARRAEMLTAMRSLKSRVEVYREQNSLVADKLALQDAALNRVAGAAQSIRQTIAEALAAGHVDTLMLDIQAQMSVAVDAMNATSDGKYLFAGGQVNTKPVTAVTLADLTLGPPITSFFQNDQFLVQAKIDDATTVTTGVLADTLGVDLLTALQSLKAYDQGAFGPFTGITTQAQQTFLESQLPIWDQIAKDLTNVTAGNGLTQRRVDSAKDALVTRDITLAGMIGDIADADMAKAATDLESAKLSVQAAAQVFAVLQNSSLLNILK
jgi:flagellar hook-associated protein 3 FlgL